ncbi:MAG: tripartite tricarboxylate transporter TctB family protein [Rhizobiales bacterium]|nr:tripartite tricarboxylate transporter TctB family protein [Hyphomicrobiales bacterium]
MSESQQKVSTGPSHRLVELGMAGLMIVFALIVIGGSMSVGFNWDFDGPRAGFFPFYIGLFILGASIVNFWQSWSDGAGGRLFAEWGQIRQVVSVVVPSTVYVALVPWIGIYVSSALLIAVFMKWLGRYGWSMVLPVAAGVPVATFIVFERWFLVPLPKGLIEELLGF